MATAHWTAMRMNHVVETDGTLKANQKQLDMLMMPSSDTHHLAIYSFSRLFPNPRASTLETANRSIPMIPRAKFMMYPAAAKASPWITICARIRFKLPEVAVQPGGISGLGVWLVVVRPAAWRYPAAEIQNFLAI